MKAFLATAAAAALIVAIDVVPAQAADSGFFADIAVPSVIGQDEVDKRGRGKGGRDKPRIPGGSGCDDPEDIIEHPECRV